jgi:hypothetical protein
MPVAVNRGKLIAGIAIGAAFVYFAIAIVVLPDTYIPSLAPPKPAPVVTDVSILPSGATKLGNNFTLRVNATNQGDHADRQIVSIAFPNMTSTDGVVAVLKSNFKQSPTFIKAGKEIGSGYAGTEQMVKAQYASVEVFSSPWQKGESFSITLLVKPTQEGRFVFLVKAIGFPHNGDQAHWPASGTLDHQNEYVSVYSVNVTKA